MRKIYAAISVVIVGLLLGGCRKGQLDPKAILFAPPTSMTPTIPASAAAKSVIPTATPSPPYYVFHSGSTPTAPLPLRSTAVIVPNQQSATSVAPADQPTRIPVPTLHLTSTTPVTLSCDSHFDTAWRSWTPISLMPFHALLVDRGILWVSTASGLFQIDPQTAVFTHTLGSDVADDIHQLFPLGEGRLWGNTSNGPLYYDGQTWSTMPITGIPILRNTETVPYYPFVSGIDRNGDLWAVSQVGQQAVYYRFPGHFPPSNGEPWIATPVPDGPDFGVCGWLIDPTRYRSLAECQTLFQTNGELGVNPPGLGWADNLLMGADERTWRLGHYTAFDKTVWVLASIGRNQIITQELPITFAGPMASDPRHGIWLGTDRGLLYADGKDLRLGLVKDLDACVGLSYVDELAVDREGQAWALTAFDGVYTLPPGALQWQSVADFTQADPGLTTKIVSIAVTEDGHVWATHGHDLFRLDNPQAMPPIPLPEDCRINIHESGKLIAKGGRVWGTGAFCGLLEFDVGTMTWSLYPWMNVPAGLLDVGADGTVYALWGGLLYMFHPGASDGPNSQWVRVVDVHADRLAADRAGGVWLASNDEGRLWYYKDLHLTEFNAPFRKYQLPHLAVDNQNRLWITTNLLSGQLNVYDGHNFREVTTPHRSTSILTIAPDSRIWMSSGEKLTVYDPSKAQQP